MALTIQTLVKRINKVARGYAVGRLQQLRAELHGKRITTSTIFSTTTVFPPRYAFHHGGRKELQFNVGRKTGATAPGGGTVWRLTSGLARLCLTRRSSFPKSVISMSGTVVKTITTRKMASS